MLYYDNDNDKKKQYEIKNIKIIMVLRRTLLVDK